MRRQRRYAPLRRRGCRLFRHGHNVHLINIAHFLSDGRARPPRQVGIALLQSLKYGQMRPIRRLALPPHLHGGIKRRDGPILKPSASKPRKLLLYLHQITVKINVRLGKARIFERPANGAGSAASPLRPTAADPSPCGPCAAPPPPQKNKRKVVQFAANPRRNWNRISSGTHFTQQRLRLSQQTAPAELATPQMSPMRAKAARASRTAGRPTPNSSAEFPFRGRFCPRHKLGLNVLQKAGQNFRMHARSLDAASAASITADRSRSCWWC